MLTKNPSPTVSRTFVSSVVGALRIEAPWPTRIAFDKATTRATLENFMELLEDLMGENLVRNRMLFVGSIRWIKQNCEALANLRSDEDSLLQSKRFGMLRGLWISCHDVEESSC